MVTITIVSDLHLGAGTPDLSRHRADALRQLVRHAADNSAYDTHRVILLGDCFELLERPTTDDADATRLQRLIDAHPATFAAVRDAVTNGVAVDIVPGNHDPGIPRPLVAATLRATAGDVTIHDRAVAVDELVLAEHGHHYHPGNAPVAAPALHGELTLPVLGHFDLARAGGARPTRAAATAAAAALRQPRLLAPVPRIAARTARRVLRPNRRSQQGDYLHHAALARDTNIRVHAFGHTHVAELFPLTTATDAAWYANPGTWLTGRYTSLSISRRDPDGPVALALRELDPARGSVRDLDAVTVAPPTSRTSSAAR